MSLLFTPFLSVNDDDDKPPLSMSINKPLQRKHAGVVLAGESREGGNIGYTFPGLFKAHCREPVRFLCVLSMQEFD